jgi:CheY-like chemotaxis protein
MAKNILVVDDEQDVLDFLRTLLEDNGYTVRSALNGIEAMQLVREERPDLILLDLQMPEETGTGFYRKLRGKKELAAVPIIVVSGLAGRNIAVGKSVKVLDKPLDETLVLQEIRQAIGG